MTIADTNLRATATVATELSRFHTLPRAASPQVLTAIAALRADVEARRNSHDIAYFSVHEERFARTAQRLIELLPSTARLLDIGSHYLHLSAIMRILGYSVTGVDVPEFVTLGLVRERARHFDLANIELDPNALPRGDMLRDRDSEFDGVLFCEILEHITFNPIAMWRRIYELLRVGGIVYITTPNGLHLLAVLGAVWNAVTLKRRGIHVEHIFSHVTYGHHWKEYGAGEIREYFGRLSPDFEVTVRRFWLPHSPGIHGPAAGNLRKLLSRLGNATGVFAENLEAVVRLRSRSKWLVTPPAFG